MRTALRIVALGLAVGAFLASHGFAQGQCPRVEIDCATVFPQRTPPAVPNCDAGDYDQECLDNAYTVWLLDEAAARASSCAGFKLLEASDWKAYQQGYLTCAQYQKSVFLDKAGYTLVYGIDMDLADSDFLDAVAICCEGGGGGGLFGALSRRDLWLRAYMQRWGLDETPPASVLLCCFEQIDRYRYLYPLKLEPKPLDKM